MRFLPYMYLLILAACAAPSIGVMGGKSDTIEVGEFTFTVNYKNDRAEAYRSNIMWAPKEPEVFAAGIVAIEQVTGCRVVRRSVRGDVAIVEADLLC